MGHSKTAKADSHRRIVEVAAQRFRELGVDGISVADLMRDADLTHGGFYRHFDSREALVDEAIERALLDGRVAADALAANPQASLGAFIDAYLSPPHRDHVGRSCAVTALAADVARSGERARTAYSAQVNRYVALIAALAAKLKQPESPAQQRAAALSALASLVGALSLARAVNDSALSEEILQVAAAELKARLA